VGGEVCVIRGRGGTCSVWRGRRALINSRFAVTTLLDEENLPTRGAGGEGWISIQEERSATLLQCIHKSEIKKKRSTPLKLKSVRTKGTKSRVEGQKKTVLGNLRTLVQRGAKNSEVYYEGRNPRNRLETTNWASWQIPHQVWGIKNGG